MGSGMGWLTSTKSGLKASQGNCVKMWHKPRLLVLDALEDVLDVLEVRADAPEVRTVGPDPVVSSPLGLISIASNSSLRCLSS